MLEKGTILDRYGKPTEGRFLSPEGTDFESRSLPSYIKTAEYTRYMVNKPFPVSEGQAAPFFGSIHLVVGLNIILRMTSVTILKRGI